MHQIKIIIPSSLIILSFILLESCSNIRFNHTYKYKDNFRTIKLNFNRDSSFSIRHNFKCDSIPSSYKFINQYGYYRFLNDTINFVCKISNISDSIIQKINLDSNTYCYNLFPINKIISRGNNGKIIYKFEFDRLFVPTIDSNTKIYLIERRLYLFIHTYNSRIGGYVLK